MGSFSEATRSRDDTQNNLLTSEDGKKLHNVSLQDDLIMENPLAKVNEEEATMEEKESCTSPTDAIVITLSIEAEEEETITKL